MLWPLVLPLQITCFVLLVAVVALTAYASPKGWSRAKSFLIYSVIGFLAFIPSCAGVMLVVDAIRFGDFHYAKFEDIPDFRSRRYLPEGATDIQMRKHPNGCLARYKLSASDFESYLDDLWAKYGEHSATRRGDDLDEGNVVSGEEFDTTFGDLGWSCPSNAVVCHSPSERDGGGATYYVDAESGIVFQRTGYW